MVIKHSTVHNPNEIVPSADWNADHTGTAPPEAHTHTHASTTGQTTDDHHAKQHALNSAADHTGTITDAQHGVRTLANAHAHSHLSGIGTDDHHAQAHTLASHSTKAHAELTNVTSDQHHAKSHAHDGIDGSGTVAHSDTTGRTANDHHAQAHTLASHSTKAHAELTDVTSDQHHAQSHNMASHTDDYSAGEGIDISVGNVISGEDATTANKGIASFNTDHFAVAAGQASLNNLVVNSINANTAHRGGDGSDHSLLTSKTSYWSCAGTRFRAVQPDVQDVTYDPVAVTADQDNVILALSADLPHGAVVTEVIVYGNAAATAETWVLYRVDHVSGIAVMATANIGTADNTIANATIDNLNYSYVLSSSSIDTNDTIYGARITYTTNYD